MLHIKKIHIISGIILILVFTIISCDQSEEEVESQDAHVCEHLTYGPAVSIKASSDFQAAIDSLAANAAYRVQVQLHTRYDVELLAASGSGYYGTIPYKPVSEEGDYTLYMDQAVGVTVLNAVDSSVVLAEEFEDHSEDCASVAYKGIYHLEPENTYLLSFSNSSESVIGLLFPKTEDEDEDHDH